MQSSQQSVCFLWFWDQGPELVTGSYWNKQQQKRICCRDIPYFLHLKDGLWAGDRGYVAKDNFPHVTVHYWCSKDTKSELSPLGTGPVAYTADVVRDDHRTRTWMTLALLLPPVPIKDVAQPCPIGPLACHSNFGVGLPGGQIQRYIQGGLETGRAFSFFRVKCGFCPRDAGVFEQGKRAQMLWEKE